MACVLAFYAMPVLFTIIHAFVATEKLLATVHFGAGKNRCLAKMALTALYKCVLLVATNKNQRDLWM